MATMQQEQVASHVLHIESMLSNIETSKQQTALFKASCVHTHVTGMSVPSIGDNCIPAGIWCSHLHKWGHPVRACVEDAAACCCSPAGGQRAAEGTGTRGAGMRGVQGWGGTCALLPAIFLIPIHASLRDAGGARPAFVRVLGYKDHESR
eukprot:365028-Chlamydomonas_euryale.AAC.48